MGQKSKFPMIPREILKKIRQIELRTNHIVTALADGARASARFTVRTPAAFKTNPALNSIRALKRRERCAPAALAFGLARIPTGFRPKARGCKERATLGHRCARFTNRNAVAAMPFSSAARGICRNPVGVDDDLISFTQGSSCVATLGYMPESRWDSLMDEIMAAVSARADSSFEFFPAMIPREILKKIRQIELRTNRIVTETLARFSFQPSPQFRRIREVDISHRTT
jgi:hypothetical protein